MKQEGMIKNMGIKEDNEKQLEEQQRLEKEKVLLQMQKEIQSLELELKHVQSLNVRNGMMQIVKLLLCLIRRVAPYALTAGIITKAFSSFNMTPFQIDDKRKEYAYIMTTFDDLGSVRQQKQYASFNDSQNVLYSYSKWEQQDDKTCSRTVTGYELDENITDALMVLLNTKNASLQELFGEPDFSSEQIITNFKEEVLQASPSLEVVTYEENKNDYIFREETVGENIFSSTVYVLLVFYVSKKIFNFRRKASSSDMLTRLEQIEKKYPVFQEQSEELRRTLKIKRDDYAKMTKNSNE